MLHIHIDSIIQRPAYVPTANKLLTRLEIYRKLQPLLLKHTQAISRQ